MANKITTVTYLDGTTHEVTISFFDRMQAEQYAGAKGWGNITESAMRQIGYATYFALRRAGLTTGGQSYEQWATTVEDFTDSLIDDKTEAESPLENGQPAA